MKVSRAPSLQMPNNTRDDWWLYPDVFCFSYTEEEYQRHWLTIKSPSRYLVINGMLLKSVNWKKHTWEQIKAGVGQMDDHCHPVKIQMAMQKLLYFGYLNGFNRADTVDFSPEFLAVYPLSMEFTTACQQPRNNESSLILQNLLIKFYNDNSNVLCGFNFKIPLNVDDYFGKSYITEGFSQTDLYTFAKLDPQQPILEECMAIDVNRTLPESKLRDLIIHHRLSQLVLNLENVISQIGSNRSYSYRGHLIELRHDAERLLGFRPSLVFENSLFFVRLYTLFAERLAVFDNEAEYYGKAYILIKSLDKDIAFTCLNDYFLENDRAWSVIEKDSILLGAWLEQLYYDVISNPDQKQRAIKGYRILTDKPMLIKTEDLPVFIEIALQYEGRIDTAELVERLTRENQGSVVARVEHGSNLLEAEDPTAPQQAAIIFHEPLSFFSRTTSAVFDFVTGWSSSMDDPAKITASIVETSTEFVQQAGDSSHQL